MSQVEIGGVIVEFDEKAVLKQELKIGDPVAILHKSEYQANPELFKGIVTDILPFENEDPCICVMYVEVGYSEVKVEHLAITKATKDYKIVKSDGQFLPLTKESALDILNKDIDKKEYEWKKAIEKKEYFLQYYNAFIRPLEDN